MGSPRRSTADAGPQRAVVRGRSMEPAVKDGDRLVIDPADAGSVRPGEIATFRDGQGRVVTHRVLGRETGGGAPVIVTQGDGRTTPDPAWSEDDLVGRVTARVRSPRRLAVRLLRLERLAWWEVAESVVTRLQSVRALRTLQRRLLAVRVTIIAERRTPATGEWLAVTCTARDDKGSPVGWQSTVRQGPDAETGRPLWLLFGLQVRLRYRGQGIARRLVAAAEAAVAREGGGRIYAFVRPHNRPSVSLFVTSGWCVASPPEGTARVPELAECLCLIKDA
jgi:ribosomal protein S18 acetylase RimI-like enzyme